MTTKTRRRLQLGIILAGTVFVFAVSLASGCSDATMPRIPPNTDTTRSDTVRTQ